VTVKQLFSVLICPTPSRTSQAPVNNLTQMVNPIVKVVTPPTLAHDRPYWSILYKLCSAMRAWLVKCSRS
jgi:hypothetical protein